MAIVTYFLLLQLFDCVVLRVQSLSTRWCTRHMIFLPRKTEAQVVPACRSVDVDVHVDGPQRV